AAGARLRSAAAGAGPGVRAGAGVGRAGGVGGLPGPGPGRDGHAVVIAVGVPAAGRGAAPVVQVVGNRGVVCQHGVVVRAGQFARVAAEEAGDAFAPRPVDEV